MSRYVELWPLGPQSPTALCLNSALASFAVQREPQNWAQTIAVRHNFRAHQIIKNGMNSVVRIAIVVDICTQGHNESL